VILAGRTFHGLHLSVRDIAATTKGKPPKARQGPKQGETRRHCRLMKYLFRLILILVLLAGIAVVAYVYFGDMSARQAPVSAPIELDLQ
jgi:hypothetical protein